MSEYELKFAIYMFEEEEVYYNIFFSEFGIKIVIHTKENGHNLPHVHVKYQDMEAVLSLIDGTYIKGNIPAKKKNFAKEWVNKHREELLKRYNEIITF
ncbi:DUF4160 domain-containing protein [Clostridium sp. AF22-10]|uniref:DUF4160 domain-containing protein n=1 Tax=Clostridium sp. AF22-10 TaxID=2293004 RepID=UPI000E54048E|nr:DUF4160 domain-containing protein [Clostridium sp. AF22-10]